MASWLIVVYGLSCCGGFPGSVESRLGGFFSACFVEVFIDSRSEVLALVIAFLPHSEVSRPGSALPGKHRS